MGLNNFNDIAWNNKSYPLSLKNVIFKREKLIKFESSFKKNIGKNFHNPPKKVVYFLGYDVSNVLHIGSLIPLLNILSLLRKSKENELLISINDIESGSSRMTEWKRIKANILKLKKIFTKIIHRFNDLYNTNIKLKFIIRSEKKEIWNHLVNIITIPHIENLFRKYYNNMPLKHLISVLVMASEFFRVSEKGQMVTSYGYEELVHLNFINELFILKGKKSLDFIVFLPITSPFNENKKMSKSEDSTTLSLIKNKNYLIKIKNKLSKTDFSKKKDLLYFWNFWSDIFKKPATYSDLEIINILEEFGS